MNLSLRTRLLASIGLPALAICTLILGAVFLRLAAEERRETVERLAVEASNVAGRFDALFQRAADTATGNARAIEADPMMPEARIEGLLRSAVAGLPSAYGAAMAFEPGSYQPGSTLFAPYVHRVGDGLVAMNIDESVYDWHGDERWSWWHAPRRSGAAIWTEPYLDEGAGGVTMVTYAMPFSGPDGRFRGVTTVDIAVDALATELADRLAGAREFLIIGGDGRLVAARREEARAGVRLSDLATMPGWESLGRLAETMRTEQRGTGRITLPDVPGPQLVGFAPIGATGWTFAFRVPEDEVLAGVRRHVVELTLGLLLTLVTILGVTWFMAGRVARPVSRLVDGVTAVAAGDLDVRVDGVERRDEVGRLAGAFNRMTGTLGETLERLADEQAGRARLERDLDMAREIQRGLLPRESLELEGFEVAGWNRPADKTGGDYYDWLPLPNGRALVTLADVTGHGIGPALIVAACRAYVRAAVVDGQGASLLETLARVNRLLAQDVGEGRFVTAALGIIEPKAGRMLFVSAGQAPILFVRSVDGLVTSWPADTVPLGVVDPLPPTVVREIAFEPGDQLVLVTDGFFEWAAADRRRFGMDRLAESIARHRQQPPADLIRRLHEDVLAFAGGTPQDDDLTAMVIRRG